MWKPIGGPGSAEYSGPRPWSEPETRAARALVERLRPDVTVWFHQPQDVVRAWGPAVPAARNFARASGLRFKRLAWLNGSATNWMNRRFPGTSTYVVEFPAGPLSPTLAARTAAAVLHQ
jgi:protein MpaA